MQEHVKATLTITLWGGIALGKKTPLIVIKRDPDAKNHGFTAWSYQQALREGLLDFLDEFELFQHDNAPIHTKDWLVLYGIRPIYWPAHSPDLNPIEHVWKALKAKLRQLHPNHHTLGTSEADRALLISWVKEAWAALPTSFIRRLIATLLHRLLAVKKSKGWYTKY